MSLVTPRVTISIPEALDRLRAGQIILVTDDIDREHEADLVVAAEFATPEAVNFMISKAKGLLCVALPGERLDALHLPQIMREGDNTESQGTAFAITVDVRLGTTTGIPASERACTIQALVDPSADAQAFRRPGHVFPLRSKPGGVLERRGHTEAAVDLTRLAGLRPGGAVCEALDGSGEALRGQALTEFAQREHLGIVAIEDLVSYRWQHDRVVVRGASAELPTRFGPFTAIDFFDPIAQVHHVALVKGDLAAEPAPLVRVHSECLTGDALGSVRCDCGEQLMLAQENIWREGCGIVLYLRQEGRGIGLGAKLSAYALQDAVFDTVEANEHLGFPADARHYGIAVQMLQALGVQRIRLMTNNPEKMHQLTRFGIDVASRVEVVAAPRRERARYMQTKREKLGHWVPPDDANVDATPEIGSKERVRT